MQVPSEERRRKALEFLADKFIIKESEEEIVPLKATSLGKPAWEVPVPP